MNTASSTTFSTTSRFHTTSLHSGWTGSNPSLYQTTTLLASGLYTQRSLALAPRSGQLASSQIALSSSVSNPVTSGPRATHLPPNGSTASTSAFSTTHPAGWTPDSRSKGPSKHLVFAKRVAGGTAAAAGMATALVAVSSLTLASSDTPWGDSTRSMLESLTRSLITDPSMMTSFVATMPGRNNTTASFSSATGNGGTDDDHDDDDDDASKLFTRTQDHAARSINDASSMWISPSVALPYSLFSQKPSALSVSPFSPLAQRAFVGAAAVAPMSSSSVGRGSDDESEGKPQGDGPESPKRPGRWSYCWTVLPKAEDWVDVGVGCQGKNDGLEGFCGEDSYFVLQATSFLALGAADGVGGWNKHGVDPSMFANHLMWHAHAAVANAAGLPVKPPSLSPTPGKALSSYAKAAEGPRVLLEEAYNRLHRARLVEAGSSTAVICVLDREAHKMYAANLGDSGFLVIRGQELVSSSSEQQHRFNAPYQLAVVPPHLQGRSINDHPSSADLYSVDVRSGDVIVVATDGFFDNVFNQDTVERVSRQVSSGKSAGQIARDLSRRAVECFDETNTPWGSKKELARGLARFGKVDDVTVLVAIVQ